MQALPFIIALFLFFGLIGIFVKPVRIIILKMITSFDEIINREN